MSSFFLKLKRVGVAIEQPFLIINLAILTILNLIDYPDKSVICFFFATNLIVILLGMPSQFFTIINTQRSVKRLFQEHSEHFIQKLNVEYWIVILNFTVIFSLFISIICVMAHGGIGIYALMTDHDQLFYFTYFIIVIISLVQISSSAKRLKLIQNEALRIYYKYKPQK